MLQQETMTSRERVIKSLNHEVPDRVPIDLGGFQTGIHKKAYASLLDHLGIQDEIKILDPVQQLAQPCEEVLQRFHVDTRYVCAHGPEGFDGSIKKVTRAGRLWHDLTDEFGIVWSMPDDQQLYMDMGSITSTTSRRVSLQRTLSPYSKRHTSMDVYRRSKR